jgi:hypothetical protein
MPIDAVTSAADINQQDNNDPSVFSLSLFRDTPLSIK